KPGERRFGLRVDALELGQDLVPDAVARVLRIGVRAVLARLDLRVRADGERLGPTDGEERPHDVVAARAHAGESGDPAPPREVEEHGLGLIVAGMARGDERRADVVGRTTEERVAQVTGVVLALRRGVR